MGVRVAKKQADNVKEGRQTESETRGRLVRYLAGALSPVNHRGLYQGYGFTGYLVDAWSPVNHMYRVISGLWLHWVT